MQVVLIKNINNLGKIGEVKNVADGYARNFLLPNNLALLATTKNIEQAKKQIVRKEKNQQDIIVDKKQLAGKLQNYVLEIKAKADASGTFFAKINKDTIVQQLQNKGIKISAKQLVLAQPIKKIGEYEVKIKIDTDQKASIKIKATQI